MFSGKKRIYSEFIGCEIEEFNKQKRFCPGDYYSIRNINDDKNYMEFFKAKIEKPQIHQIQQIPSMCKVSVSKSMAKGNNCEYDNLAILSKNEFTLGFPRIGCTRLFKIDDISKEYEKVVVEIENKCLHPYDVFQECFSLSDTRMKFYNNKLKNKMEFDLKNNSSANNSIKFHLLLLRKNYNKSKFNTPRYNVRISFIDTNSVATNLIFVVPIVTTFKGEEVRKRKSQKSNLSEKLYMYKNELQINS